MNLPDEIPGKGSNLNYTGHQVQKVIDEMGIAYEDIIVSSFDVDTAVHPEYFACLTTKFLEQDNPYRCSYQPVTLYGNNIWQSSAPVRIGVFGTTFWLMSELARPERLWTFSSHSMSFKMLVDVGFWEKDIVSEDSRIFLQGFFHYHGDYSVVPIYVPVNMDAVAGGSYWDSLVSLYKQQRRWAWGVEHLPYLITHFSKDKLIPLKKKIKFVFNHIEGMYTWATAPILIFALGYLPLFMARDIQTVIVRNAPFTLEWIMRFAMIGVLISAIFATTLLPRRPAGVRRRNWVVMILQWLLLPITFVVFGAFPAIDAQTRLMLGKYLGFKVTKKTR